MDIGDEEKETVLVEPIRDPVTAPEAKPEKAPAPVRVPEKIPARSQIGDGAWR